MMLRRFEKVHEPRPDKVRKLDAAHPAVVSGNTIFPSTVVNAADAPRLLVSGVNNRKIGDVVQVGPWAGMSIYMLTLEERATCPRTCAMWRDCYGNAMHRARRHRHGPEFEARLSREIAFLARENPRGFVVRLHVLGDFNSVDYVRVWFTLLERHPELHVFGYTARSLRHDPEIAKAVCALSGPRWAIRFSSSVPQPNGATVVMAADPMPNAFVCPAETSKTACCATCGLCWAPAARDKTVLFLRHGMMGARKRKAA